MKRHFFLFNDILIYGTSNSTLPNQQPSYTFARLIPLDSKFRVKDMRGSDGKSREKENKPKTT
jgi:hypothetical protein